MCEALPYSVWYPITQLVAVQYRALPATLVPLCAALWCRFLSAPLANFRKQCGSVHMNGADLVSTLCLFLGVIPFSMIVLIRCLTKPFCFLQTTSFCHKRYAAPIGKASGFGCFSTLELVPLCFLYILLGMCWGLMGRWFLSSIPDLLEPLLGSGTCIYHRSSVPFRLGSETIGFPRLFCSCHLQQGWL